MLGLVQTGVEAEYRASLQSETAAPGLDNDLINLAILRRHATLYERRWQAGLARAFDGWPHSQSTQPPAASRGYALISDEELQSQLVGQPVIEALDRRFTDILDVIDSRLWSFAASFAW